MLAFIVALNLASATIFTAGAYVSGRYALEAARNLEVAAFVLFPASAALGFMAMMTIAQLVDDLYPR